MMRRMIGAAGLGLLGIDPITAFYILSMGLRKEKKSNISSFMLSFVVVSVFPAAVLSVIFGTKAADLIKGLLPDDASPFWAYLEFAISVIILIWIFAKALRKKTDNKERKAIVNGPAIKYASMGFVFAVMAYTDPTYYAVILLGGETGNFLSALLLLALWLFISQSPAMIVYGAIQTNCLKKLVDFTDRIKNSNIAKLKWVFYVGMIVIAVLLMIDSGFYLIRGNYLF